MRNIIMEQLYNFSKVPYQKWFKSKPAWTIKREQLLKFPKDSLGYNLGCFLEHNNFELEEKLENHDVFHVLTKTGTTVPEEISMQFYLFGNGKRSIYQTVVIIIGCCLYPDYINRFFATYLLGKKSTPFYHIDYLKLLKQPIANIIIAYNIKPTNTKQYTTESSLLIN